MKEVNLNDLSDKELKTLFKSFKKEWSDVEWNVFKIRIMRNMEVKESLWGIDDKRYKAIERLWKTMIEVQEEE